MNEKTGVMNIVANIVSTFVSRHKIEPTELAAFINRIYDTVTGLEASDGAAPADAGTPAVPIKKSVTPDYLICLEDGKRFKSLKRHLATHYSLTPEQYREKWGLPADYPMVAPNYAARRSQLAKKIGLGRKPEARRRRG